MTFGSKFLCCAAMLFVCFQALNAASVANVVLNASGKETISAQEFEKSIASRTDYIQTEDRFASLYEDHREKGVPFFLVRIQKPGAEMPHYCLAYRFVEHFSKRRTNPFTNETITEDDVSYFRAEAGSKDFVKICTLRELLVEDALSQNQWQTQISASAQALREQSNAQVILVKVPKEKIEPSAPVLPPESAEVRKEVSKAAPRVGQSEQGGDRSRQAAWPYRLFRNIPSVELLTVYTLIGLVHGATNSWLAGGATNHNFWWAPWTETMTHLLFFAFSSDLRENPSGWRKKDAYKWAWLNLCYGGAQMLGESMPRVPYTIIPAFTLSGTWRNAVLNRSLAMIPVHLWRAA